MTTAQYKLQNKDLKILLNNHKAARQISEDNLNAHIKELEQALHDKDKTILMLQAYIASREAAYNSLKETYTALQKEIVTAADLNKNLQNKVDALTARINKDSSNSGKPPSSDGLKKVIRNNRQSTTKKPGGQFGHKGRTLKFTEKLNELIASGEVPVEVVEHGNPSISFTSRFEIDIKTVAVVKEHRFYQGATIPGELNNLINYGPHLKAMCVDLSVEGLVAAQRTANFVSAITNGAIKPSKASILAFQKDISAKLELELETMRKDVLDSNVLCVDETAIKCTQRPTTDDKNIEESKGTTFNICVRTYSSNNTTFLTVNGHKNIESVISDNILSQFTNIMMHDHDTKYYNFGTGNHGECNVHIVRYLIGIFEITHHQWAVRMAKLLLTILNHKNIDIKDKKKLMDADSLRRYSDEYDEIIALAKTENAALSSKSQIANDERCLFTRLEKYKKNHLLFAYDYTAPFSNNSAESDLRWLKTQQKVSGCHRSFDGATTTVRLMSFIKTLKKRNIEVFPALFDVLNDKRVLSEVKSSA